MLRVYQIGLVFASLFCVLSAFFMRALFHGFFPCAGSGKGRPDLFCDVVFHLMDYTPAPVKSQLLFFLFIPLER